MRRTRLLIVSAAVLAVIILAIVLYVFYTDELLTHVVRPAIQAYYIGRYYLEFIPQLFLWLVPPVVVAVLLIRRMNRQARQERSRRVRRRFVSPVAPGEGELAQLDRQIARAHHSRFARVRLSRSLMEIAARLIAGRERVPLSEARAKLADGYWRDAHGVHHFLVPRRHYTAQQSGQEFEAMLRRTVEHLEAFDRGDI